MTQNEPFALRVDASIGLRDAFIPVNDATMVRVHETSRRSDAFVTVDGAIVVTSDASIAIDGAFCGRGEAIVVIDDAVSGTNEAIVVLDDGFGRPIDALVAIDEAITRHVEESDIPKPKAA